MTLPERGEFFSGPLLRTGHVYGEANGHALRLNVPNDSPNLTVVPRSTRKGRVPNVHQLPGSVLSPPFPGTELDKWAELFCWAPRSVDPNDGVSGRHRVSPDNLTEIEEQLRAYISPNPTHATTLPPPLLRRGHVIVRNDVARYVVLSHNAAAAWRWRAQPPRQIVSVVAVDIEDSWSAMAGSLLGRRSDTHPAEAKFEDQDGLPIAVAYLDTLNTLDLRFIPGPWRLDERHLHQPSFGVFAAVFTRALLRSLRAYLGLGDPMA